jgi:probable phosphoglycerate mutase
MSAPAARAVLVRHAETEWTLSGRHTGRTDLPLTERGREAARQLARRLSGLDFALVLVSPARRARETCELCGLGHRAQPREDLREWDYGDYEGITTTEVRRERPDWTVWDGPIPSGESIDQVAARADRIVAAAQQATGDVLVFSHGHLLRILTARWLALEPEAGRLFALDPATVSVLGYEHEQRVMREWNARCSPA